MSHLRERKEKNCLNCNAEVQGRFCHICGQENIEARESFWHLVTHFFYDITHFDGKFFSTLKYLLFKPGFLSHEYLRGRRASYLHPIRMYVFTSAFFFLIFFSLQKEEEMINLNEKKQTATQVLKDLAKQKKRLTLGLKDSLPDIVRQPLVKSIRVIDSDIADVQKDSTAKDHLRSRVNTISLFSFSGGNTMYHTVTEYDSAQARLPIARRAGFIERRFARQNLYLREKYNNDNKAIGNAILTKFRHLFPQMLFTSLPLFALMLQLLYQRRKIYYYVNHVVYTIHLYCATFIIILLGILAEKLAGYAGTALGEWTIFICNLWALYYLYKSMRNFYGQSRGKTVLKYFLVLFLSLFIMVFMFTTFFIFSAMAI